MKTFYKTLLILSFYFPSCLLNNVYGQGENNIWYFGYHSGLDFNSGNPVVLTNGQTDDREGTATISDPSGNLLFYSDGDTVWNRNHLIMPDGTGLTGHTSSTQSATIVPKPGSTTEYYVFTAPEHSSTLDFSYSIVDMTLDGGYGDIALKNVSLFSNSTEKCVAIYKGNTQDIWVIGLNKDTAFYSYLVTSSGINPPVLSFHQPTSGNYGYDIGYMKASPQGDKIAIANYGGNITDQFHLFDFDCSTGIISNQMSFSTGDILYGLEFSPDGSKLYVFPWGAAPLSIYQYDVTLSTAAAIAASQIIVGTSNHSGIGDGQIGPDQKIYLSIDFRDSLSVINNPNAQGAACNFVDNVIYLNGNTSGIGFPALIRGSVCGTTAITEIQNDLNEFQIFPNPSNGIFQITLPNFSNPPEADGKVSYEVVNTLGQTVFQSELQTLNAKLQTNLDLSFLPKSIYILRISNSVSTFSKKLIIN
ncbi:MAG TPA: T9SS type A sorting domain-containing protein [Bacteroidia bacterium]|nr:T9SS type A sorting domain-containing protein [Bacteroidia bacterium]